MHKGLTSIATRENSVFLGPISCKIYYPIRLLGVLSSHGDSLAFCQSCHFVGTPQTFTCLQYTYFSTSYMNFHTNYKNITRFNLTEG